MDDTTFAAKLWTTGFGNSQNKFSGKTARTCPQRRALSTDWNTLPMPRERTEIELRLPVTAEELDVLARGHVPEAMEDHWFMYFDGESLCFHRSWTGTCIYRIHVRHTDDGYELASTTVNRDPGQYSATSDTYDALVATALVGEALGKDMHSTWERAFKVDEQPDQAHPIPQTIGFWSADGVLGCCSNWHPSGFDFLGTTFPTAEHWIMWQKAQAMGDLSSAEAILAAQTPKHAKELGKGVKPYDDLLWRNVREQLAFVGVREKFLQNRGAARELLATGNAVLAEASPYDGIWGVGIAATDHGFTHMTGWRGDNLLGRICMRVRADLTLVRDRCPRHEWHVAQEDVDRVLSSGVGRMSLIALTRNPTTRSAAMCYARIAQHHVRSIYPTLTSFLTKPGQATLTQIEKSWESSKGRVFVHAGWRELLAELAFLMRIGVA